MDGVLADFVGGVFSLLGISHVEQISFRDSWPTGEYDITKVINISTNALWSLIDAKEDFWLTLTPLMEGMQLFNKLQGSGEVYISTSPSRHPTCASGKVAWIQRYIKPNFRKYMIGCDKFIFANPSAILIDDHDKNIEKFRQSGGTGILWPQPWNSEAELIKDTSFSRVGHVLSQLKDTGHVRL